MRASHNEQPLEFRDLEASPDMSSTNRYLPPREGVVSGVSGRQCPSHEILFDGDSECEVISLCFEGDPDFDGSPDAAILLYVDPLSSVDLVIGVGENWVTQNCREGIADGVYEITVERAHPPNAASQYLFDFTITTSGAGAERTLAVSKVSVTGPL